jgi:hypothetical protein
MNLLVNLENSIGNHSRLLLEPNNLESALDMRLSLGHQSSLALEQDILTMSLVRLPDKLLAKPTRVEYILCPPNSAAHAVWILSA